MRPRVAQVLALGLAAAAAAGAELPAPTFAASSDPSLTDPSRDSAWSDLFAQLAVRRARQSAFTERRFFPFHRNPVVLTGEVRIDPGRGMSLAYLTPEPRTLVIDQQGILLRDSRGRERAAPADARSAAATQALVKVLRFDLPDLARQFTVQGLRQGADWRLTFTPRDSSAAAGLSRLIVTGANRHLLSIALVKSPNERVEIAFRDTTDDVTFSPEILARYFR